MARANARKISRTGEAPAGIRGHPNMVAKRRPYSTQERELLCPAAVFKRKSRNARAFTESVDDVNWETNALANRPKRCSAGMSPPLTARPIV